MSLTRDEFCTCDPDCQSCDNLLSAGKEWCSWCFCWEGRCHLLNNTSQAADPGSMIKTFNFVLENRIHLKCSTSDNMEYGQQNKVGLPGFGFFPPSIIELLKNLTQVRIVRGGCWGGGLFTKLKLLIVQRLVCLTSQDVESVKSSAGTHWRELFPAVHYIISCFSIN